MKIMQVAFSASVAFAAAVCLAMMTFGAEITGPESVQIGQLATFSADTEGDWIILPAKGVGLAKDTGRKACYVAITQPGEYTLLFFAVESGKPVITQKVLLVGDIPIPEPQPAPAPVVTLTAAEREAVSSSMSSILRGMDAGTIRTPQGARATFKKLLSDKLCSGGTCSLSPNLKKAIIDWEAGMDITTIEGIRAGFEKIVEVLK